MNQQAAFNEAVKKALNDVSLCKEIVDAVNDYTRECMRIGRYKHKFVRYIFGLGPPPAPLDECK